MVHQAARQSLVIVCASVFLGFSYTYLSGKGFFGSQDRSVAVHTEGAPPAAINLAEAKRLFESDSAVFVDSRHFFDFRRGHIKSAINLPLADLEDRTQTLASLPRNKIIVVYCDGAECNSSIELGARLYERGFGGVKIFFGGWEDWTANNLPTETSQ